MPHELGEQGLRPTRSSASAAGEVKAPAGGAQVPDPGSTHKCIAEERSG